MVFPARAGLNAALMSVPRFMLNIPRVRGAECDARLNPRVM